jgi:hypothetical protein
MAGFRLDIREEALKRTKLGAVPIVPGKPAESAIVQRIFATNPAKIMPPKYAHKELTEAQKETIRRWVLQGAPYEGHWAYAPVKRPLVPPSASDHPIDVFIHARLKQEGFDLSPEAERTTLLRRITFDLTGLPPTPEELRAFLKDRSSDAYEKVVDRLMASPRFAEKQAMHWLDVVRYADTCGFHGDNPVPAWPYRDYVLRAFSNNKPFDVFTREQIAGDLLPDAGVEQKVASAYNRLTRTSAEGGIQPKEYLAKYASDRVRTTASAWLGSTLGCAECHDHKFDPFTAKDFYSMKAFFADINETGLVPDRGPAAWGSQVALPDDAQRKRLDEISQIILELEKERLKSASAGAEEQLLRRFESGELSWKLQRPLSAKSEFGAILTVYNDEAVDNAYDDGGSVVTARKPGDGLVVASGPNPDNEVYTVTLQPRAGVWTALGIEVVVDDSLPGGRMARGADRFVLTAVEVESAGSRVPLILATAAMAFPSIEAPAMAAIDGDRSTGWGSIAYGETRNPFLALRFGQKIETQADSVITVRLRHDSQYRRAAIGRFRLALSSAEHSWPGRFAAGGKEPTEKQSGLPEAVLKALRTVPEKRKLDQIEAIAEYLRWSSPDAESWVIKLATAERDLNLVDASIPRVFVTQSTKPSVTRVLPRGNWMDDSGEVVVPAVPAFLGKVQTTSRATRLDLANWIVSQHNPLTARVFANRMWRQFFGQGISKVLDDLGSQGEWPSHPELLDWLAAEFMQPSYRASGTHAWDIKHLVRTIVTSRTYRQSSAPHPADAKDPDNRLLARQNRFRVDAENVRDAALAMAGLLDTRFGGPSVRPYQPDGYLAALNFPKREYSASRGADLYRRGVYVQWQRTFLHPAMAAFDAPSREECIVNRVNSNTPLQALVLLNDPSFVEAARVFAQNILTQGGWRLKRKIEWAFMRAVNRKPDKAEMRILTDLHKAARERFKAHPEEAKALSAVGEAPRADKIRAADLAAMTTVARAILNLHDTITRN